MHASFHQNLEKDMDQRIKKKIVNEGGFPTVAQVLNFDLAPVPRWVFLLSFSIYLPFLCFWLGQPRVVFV